MGLHGLYAFQFKAITTNISNTDFKTIRLIQIGKIPLNKNKNKTRLII